MGLPFVSVIIPTYRDDERLQKCVAAISKMNYPMENIEVLIVDNDSLILSRNWGKYPFQLRWIHEPEGGSYSARNRGVMESRYEVLAFTDADCIPDKNWLQNAVGVIKSGAARVGGRVELFFGSRMLNGVELYEKLTAFPQEEYIRNYKACVTANLVSKKKNFLIAGLFDGSLETGGDIEWGKRCQLAGIDIEYVESSIIYHPARSTLSHLLAKQRRVVSGISIYEPGFYSQKFSSFLIRVGRGLTPPLTSLVRYWKDPRFTIVQRLKIFSVFYIVKLARTYYLARLRWKGNLK